MRLFWIAVMAVGYVLAMAGAEMTHVNRGHGLRPWVARLTAHWRAKFDTQWWDPMARYALWAGISLLFDGSVLFVCGFDALLDASGL